jgi:DNA-binding NarL/FixJ family response regulator
MNNASAIRVVVFQRRCLDREALAALFHQATGYELLCSLTNSSETVTACKQFRPDVTILDALTPERNAFLIGGVLLHNGYSRCLIFIDDEPNDRRAHEARQLPNTDYVSRHVPFVDVVRCIVTTLYGGAHPRSAPIRRPTATNGSGAHRLRIDQPGLSLLSDRESQVFRLLAEGHSVRQCAESLRLSQSTIDNHKSRLMKKLQIHKTVELVRVAIRMGIIPP